MWKKNPPDFGGFFFKYNWDYCYDNFAKSEAFWTSIKKHVALFKDLNTTKLQISKATDEAKVKIKDFETELSINTYRNILASIKGEVIANSKEKAGVYRKLLNTAKYYNSIYPEEYNPLLGEQQYYIITKEGASTLYFKYKDFVINKNICKSDYEILFNTKEAAKRAIDILGDELNILFE